MTVYKVRPGCSVTWPDGSVRAAEGECFEGFDNKGSAAARALAASLLEGQARAFVVADAADAADIRRDLPAEVEEALLFLNVGTLREAAPPKPAKPATTEKKPRAKKAADKA